MVAYQLPGPQVTWSGLGSLPGDQFDQALRLALQAAPELPFLPELPARGTTSEMIGRAAGLLVDLPVDLVPAGWRLVARPGRDHRRLIERWQRDLDTLTELADDYDGQFKIQLAGPWTLAANMKLPAGESVLVDTGAVNDLIASFTEGVIGHLDEVARRLPNARLVLQLDEPSLPAVHAGLIRSASGFTRLSPIDTPVLQQGLATVIHGAKVPLVIHCCAPNVPVALLRHAGANGVSLDINLIDLEDSQTIDPLAEAIEQGFALWPGIVSTVASPEVLSDVAASVKLTRTLWSRLGSRPTSTVITPTCGLAATTETYARAALDHCRQVASALADPED